ncbi:MAG: DNA-binding protein, partial [Gammaproteobacteria bacterium]|nr:DNA-binding protein [Gammaproteobacteria bacterium]
MKALFIAWQDPDTRSWSPVGRLTHEENLFRFVYTRGAEELGNKFQTFGAMTDLHSSYISETLFPLFSNRVLPKSRPEYKTYLEWLNMSESAYDVMDELSLTGGFRATDSLELFPCPEPTDHKYVVYFFSRGLRHMHKENQERVNQLKKGDRLSLMLDVQNEYDQHALVL